MRDPINMVSPPAHLPLPTAQMEGCYAHSLPNRPFNEWEGLAAHARSVAALAAEFAAIFGWEGMARAAGLLHDAGKASAEFQAYIHGDRPGSVDHSTKGARIATELYPRVPARMLALCIAGHHAGLADPEDLERRLDPNHSIPDATRWTDHIEALAPNSLRSTRPMRADKETSSFTQAFLVRMLFSCLVDADFLATEAFMSGGTIQRGVAVGMDVLHARLATYMRGLETSADPTDLNALRAEIRAHALAKAAEQPGLFTLTVPTGGGKTLASLGFALAHARKHCKRRVIYVIPFTSIIEQTAQVFRDAIGDDAVLEHHSSYDWEHSTRRTTRDGGDEKDELGLLRLAAENWDAPLIVTTAVQFFESLFANRTSACRKLHNIADSVVVLDEAQTLPQGLLLPCLAALSELTRNYGASVVLCTATQPALRRQDGALGQRPNGSPLGLDIPDDRELAPRPRELYTKLKRTQVEVLPGEITDEHVAARFAERPQMLCIVNTRKHAHALFERIAGLPGAAHLSTLMCPLHRRQVLAELRMGLKAGEAVRLVATSLIEAGVDISFPEVWRAEAGIDSIAQAAGRCNREGELLPALGRVVVFTPAEAKLPRAFVIPQQAAQVVLRNHKDDPLSLEAITAFFSELYFQKGSEALDTAKVDGSLGSGVLQALHERAEGLRFPFDSIARAFRLIDDTMQPVVVPWNAAAEAALRAVVVAERPPRAELRKLQQFTVGIPRKACAEWLALGVVVPVRASMGDALLRFVNTTHYRPRTGIDLTNMSWWDANYDL
jgi:CRISPR-associated endonuclease/helicase Cas3